eukprot:m.10445 g.10445  ORF g.10445 m.10445 type:complete len:357 (+) comp22312_c0_seq1:261-1331(+)
MIGSCALGSAVIGPFARYLRIRTFFLFTILCATIGFGICAVTVGKCEENVSFTRIAYIASFAFIGMSSMFSYLGNFEFMLSLFPRHIGMASCLLGFGVSIGGIAWAQFFLAMEKYTEKGSITLSTVFLLSAVLAVGITIPGLCFSRSRQLNRPEDILPKEGEERGGKCFVIRSGTYWILFIIRVVVLVPGFGLLSRQKTFLKSLWPLDTPVVALAIVAQACYTVGRILSVLAEFCSAYTLLVLDFAVGAICIGFLPVFLEDSVGGVIIYGLYSLTFGMHKPLIGPVSGKLFGNTLATEGVGMLGLAYGVGGIVGPLLMEMMYQSEGGYKSFLYLSCGLAFLGYTGLILMLCHSQRS